MENKVYEDQIARAHTMLSMFNGPSVDRLLDLLPDHAVMGWSGGCVYVQIPCREALYFQAPRLEAAIEAAIDYFETPQGRVM